MSHVHIYGQIFTVHNMAATGAGMDGRKSSVIITTNGDLNVAGPKEEKCMNAGKKDMKIIGKDGITGVVETGIVEEKGAICMNSMVMIVAGDTAETGANPKNIWKKEPHNAALFIACIMQLLIFPFNC